VNKHGIELRVNYYDRDKYKHTEINTAPIRCTIKYQYEMEKKINIRRTLSITFITYYILHVIYQFIYSNKKA